MGSPPVVPPTVDTPVVNNSTVQHAAIDKELQDSLASLAHKHVSVSYGLMGIILALFLVMGGAAYVANKFWERDVARAEAAEKRADAAAAQAAESQKLMEQYKAQSDKITQQFNDTLQKDQELRAKDAQIIASLQQQIKARDAAAAQHKTELLAKDKTAQQAYDDVKSEYKDLKSPMAAGKDPAGNDTLTFVVPDVQEFSAAKSDADSLSQDVDDLQKEDAAKDRQIASLTADLGLAQQTIAAQKTTIDQAVKTIGEKDAAIADKDTAIKEYKKAAKVGRWRRIGGWIVKVGLFAGGAYLGHAI